MATRNCGFSSIGQRVLPLTGWNTLPNRWQISISPVLCYKATLGTRVANFNLKKKLKDFSANCVTRRKKFEQQMMLGCWVQITKVSSYLLVHSDSVTSWVLYHPGLLTRSWLHVAINSIVVLALAKIDTISHVSNYGRGKQLWAFNHWNNDSRTGKM